MCSGKYTAMPATVVCGTDSRVQRQSFSYSQLAMGLAISLSKKLK
jgi:hypothetical protein